MCLRVYLQAFVCVGVPCCFVILALTKGRLTTKAVGSIRQRALHIQKRALYIHKKALYIRQKALYIHKRALYMSTSARTFPNS